MEQGFLITSFIDNIDHLNCLDICIQSILQFYIQKQIVVIVSYNSNLDLISLLESKYPEIIFEKDTPKCPAICLTFYFINKNKYFKKTIVIHDSMTIRKPINVDTIEKIKFLWHFTNHRVHWHTIEEPRTEYNIMNNIKTHDDLILHMANKYIDIPEFKIFFNEIYYKKNLWVGCFGSTYILNSEFLQKLQEKTHIIELLQHFNDNRERRAAESVLAIACSYALNEHILDSYDGLYFDGINHSNHGISEHITKRMNSFNR